ncbi:unnamed protein product [Periconia digitata]|uniref:Uncharacterized protein n=1 Tax=Periconia digitata TaxID=1303443 RepID=A0A9W4XK96_9PLEO|nr:unnamed protein product [Periconia digitata]
MLTLSSIGSASAESPLCSTFAFSLLLLRFRNDIPNVLSFACLYNMPLSHRKRWSAPSPTDEPICPNPGKSIAQTLSSPSLPAVMQPLPSGATPRDQHSPLV